MCRRVDLADRAAGAAFHPQGHGHGLDLRPLRSGAFGQHVQVHLHALGHHAGERPQLEPDGPDAGGVLFGGRLERDLQDALRDGKFVHGPRPLGLQKRRSCC